MKLNNKGMSLMEILVTIILISLVVVFLFKLLIDLKDERSNNDFAYDNQINRAEAIYTIEKDLYTYSLRKIKKGDTSNNNGNLKLSFLYSVGTSSGPIGREAVLDISKEDATNEDDTKYFVNYTSADGEKYSWEMKGAKIDSCGTFTYYLSNNNYYFKLVLPIYNRPYHPKNNKTSNNPVDDFEISFAGQRGNLELSDDNLIKQAKGTIDICAN